MAENCPTCLRPLDVERVCPVCHSAWMLSLAESQWFAKRGLAAPRRCAACRRDHKKTTPTEQGVPRAEAQP